jgi:hypothetical protein
MPDCLILGAEAQFFRGTSSFGHGTVRPWGCKTQFSEGSAVEFDPHDRIIGESTKF